ncbi:phage transcriptional regulator, AlpA [Solidesulfovibrio carbinoliphilus subsp. oakridgensis]|uniref:Phage transcriptional regulator, AlpA n=1 Tax=Solidesulfovibrio carbinoliphilus subsp. oakridgensis TaxID=694327 RepID=G7QC88_9BACT|nr:phage transcriptional regulator, AlpA [Solidesulfovibrio carbinoliphilus subsp. oakridgensis]
MPVIVKSAKRISEEIGYGRETIPALVAHGGLPAWKEDGVWRAVYDELVEWAKQRRVEQQGRRVRQ